MYRSPEVPNFASFAAAARAGNPVDGTQVHMLSYLGATWGMGEPRFTAEQAIAFTHKVRDAGGAVTWDVPVELNGTLPAAFLDQLWAIGKALGTAH